MALSKNAKLAIVCFLVIGVICIGTLAVVKGDFGGSDDAGGDVVEEYGYEPWTGNWMEDIGFELPPETESLLFAVQAAIGAIIIGYFIGLNSAKKKAAAAESKAEAETE